MSAGKIVALVLGILAALLGLVLLVPGAALLGFYGTQRDSDGFFKTSSHILSTNGSALVTPDMELDLGPVVGEWLLSGDKAAVRIEASSSSGDQLFVGVGPSRQVARYLKDVDYDELTGFGWFWSPVSYRHIDGSVSASPPGEQDFWITEQEGSGVITLDWDVREGSWMAVLMNADGSAPVWADVSVGARVDFLLGIGIGITVGGAVLLGVGILLIVIGARRSKTPPNVQGQVPVQPSGPPSGPPPGTSSAPPSGSPPLTP